VSTTTTLKKHLQANGWACVDTRPLFTLWRKDDQEILVPSEHPRPGDYKLRLREALTQVGVDAVQNQEALIEPVVSWSDEDQAYLATQDGWTVHGNTETKALAELNYLAKSEAQHLSSSFLNLTPYDIDHLIKHLDSDEILKLWIKLLPLLDQLEKAMLK